MSNTVGALPEFTDETGTEEVKQPITEEVVEEGKDAPTELPAEEEKPATQSGENTGIPEELINQAVARATEGLRGEITGLRQKLAQATGSDRTLVKKELIQKQDQLDDLKDVNPQDVEFVEKVLRSKGYMTKQEALELTYEEVKNQELNKFLEEFPEYKPENDPTDERWSQLQKEFSEYAKPSDAHRLGYLLRKAHKAVAPPTSDRTLPARIQQIKTAGVGSGGNNRSSSPTKSLDPEKIAMLKQGGFTDEDIKSMESKLS
jgi:hypothetical protein